MFLCKFLHIIIEWMVRVCMSEGEITVGMEMEGLNQRGNI